MAHARVSDSARPETRMRANHPLRRGFARPGSAATPALRGAAGRMASTWAVLATAPGLFSPMGFESATLISFGLCTLLALTGRRARTFTPGRFGRKRSSAPLAALAALAGLGAGWALMPGLAQAVLQVGDVLGVPGPVPETGVRGPALLVATVLLAPVFEELIYREALLPALSARFGHIMGIILSSAAFALPHATPWSMLGSFVAGLLLGAAMSASRSTPLCIGLHAGFNLRLAALAWAPV